VPSLECWVRQILAGRAGRSPGRGRARRAPPAGRRPARLPPGAARASCRPAAGTCPSPAGAAACSRAHTNADANCSLIGVCTRQMARTGWRRSVGSCTHFALLVLSNECRSPACACSDATLQCALCSGYLLQAHGCRLRTWSCDISLFCTSRVTSRTPLTATLSSTSRTCAGFGQQQARCICHQPVSIMFSFSCANHG